MWETKMMVQRFPKTKVTSIAISHESKVMVPLPTTPQLMRRHVPPTKKTKSGQRRRRTKKGACMREGCEAITLADSQSTTFAWATFNLWRPRKRYKKIQ